MKKSISIGITLILGAFLCASSFAAKEMVQVKGSDTLINLVQRLSEVYMQKNPGQYIAVTGGGSGTGIAALINKKCDIANASRLMKPKEIIQAKEAGVNPKRVVIALDGVCIIVNSSNPVKKLTVDEIGKIYSGKIANWADVGGDNSSVNIYGRQSNSGTYAFVQEEVVKGDYSKQMKEMNGNAQIVEAVKTDKTGIGYVGVGYAKTAEGVVILKVAKSAGGEYASPLVTSDINTGKYPLTRPLNQYLKGEPSGVMRGFIAFELSPEGQRIVDEEGFFPIPSDYEKLNKASVGI